MARAVEIFATVHFLVMGLSHIIHRRTWAEFFMWLHKLGRSGVFIHGFISLGFGSVIVAFHNVWSGLPVVLTIVGWLYIFKALLCFLAPQTQIHTLGRVSPEGAREFIFPGTLFIAMAGLLLYILWRQ